MSRQFRLHSHPLPGRHAPTHPPTPVDRHATGPPVVASPPSNNHHLSLSTYHLSPYHHIITRSPWQDTIPYLHILIPNPSMHHNLPRPLIKRGIDVSGLLVCSIYAYTKKEVMIDSNEACEDVRWYLRQLAHLTLKRKQWPSELEFMKIAIVAGGLFVYASTVIRYISDTHYGDPASQLSDVLVAIDASPKDAITGTH